MRIAEEVGAALALAGMLLAALCVWVKKEHLTAAVGLLLFFVLMVILFTGFMGVWS